MTLLTLQPGGHTADVPPGTSLLDAIRSAGGALAGKCGGEAQCGACHVFVTEGRKGLSRLTSAENARLDTMVGVGSKSRLACQATLSGSEPVTVELLGALSG
ncbi:MAG: (2Fe-2S)-binding protein [Burkholderiales bacterium]|nr:(2Fe-2S)-binding protein [Burkholderiales bacterium]